MTAKNEPKQKRKPWRMVIAAMLSLSMVFSMIPLQAIAEDADVQQGDGQELALNGETVEDVTGAESSDVEMTIDDVTDHAPSEESVTAPEEQSEDVETIDQREDGAGFEEESTDNDEDSVGLEEAPVEEFTEEDAIEEDASEEGLSEADKEDAVEIQSANDAETTVGFVNTVVGTAGDGLHAQASDTVEVFIYNDNVMKIGKNLSTTNLYIGWYCGDNGVFYDQTQVGNPNPWRSYSSRVKQVIVTSSVSTPNCSDMFRGMSSITSINVSKLNVSSCTSFANMFYGCTQLKTLDMTGWSTSWTNSTDMYYNCKALSTIKVGSGFYFSTRFPAYSINGHTDWYSSSAKKWFTVDEIYYQRDRTADTYTKSVPASSKRSINNKNVKVSIATQAWTGKRLKPTPTVKWGSTKLTKGKHFKIIAYGTNKNNGTKGNWVQIQGIGSYTGKRKITFRIRKPNVTYRTHVQTYGWEKSWKSNGATSGTTGQSKRLEGIYIKLTNKPVTGGISYRTHIQTYGWEKSWKSNGKMSGTTGKSKRLEAIQIKLTGNMAKKYDVWYCVHAQHFGWLGWAKNGASAGTAGYSYRLEGIKIKLLPKGSSKPAAIGSTTVTFRDKNYRMYKLTRDTWNFNNYSAYIPLSYYQRCFGSSKGYALYYDNSNPGYAGGVCYGMAASPGSMRKYSYPKVSSFGASKIYNIDKYDRSSTLGMDADSFIQYCYVCQEDSRLQQQMRDNALTSHSAAQKLVNAVKTHQVGGTAMVIDLMDAPRGSHAVMPLSVGTDNSSKTVINVYDSNSPTQTQQLTLHKNGGRYTRWSYSDDLGYEWVSYETPASRIKSIMAGGGKALNSDGMKLISTTSDITVESGGRTYTLSPDATDDLSMVTPVKLKDVKSDGKQLYWVGFDTTNMKIHSVAQDTTVLVCADTSAVEVNIRKGGLAAMSVSDADENSASITGDKGDSFQVSYLEFSEDGGEPTRTTVNGKVKGTKDVKTRLTPQGDVDVSGAKDLSVE